MMGALAIMRPPIRMRLAALHMIDLPRYAALNPAALAELRAIAPGESITSSPVAVPSATQEAS